MKKTFLILLIGTAALFTPTGCKKPGGSAAKVSTNLPDITDFVVQPTGTFVFSYPAQVNVTSSTLGNGTFTVKYTLGGGYNSGSGTATLAMYNGSGGFKTMALPSGGPTTVTVDSVSYPAGAGASPNGNNVSSLIDSSGTMTATYTPSGGSPISFYATEVYATASGGILTINSVMWTPKLTIITLYDYVYSAMVGTTYFNVNVPGGMYSSDNGSATFAVSGTTGGISDTAVHGAITRNTVSFPSGSFTFTNKDSSVVAGTFNCRVQ